MKKTLSLLLALSICLCALTSCTGGAQSSATTESEPDSTASSTRADAGDTTEVKPDSTAEGSTDGGSVPSGEHTYVKFTMENGGTFTLELYAEYAPKTVENFVSLVSSGFYNGLTFHRVIEGFMAQGGDPLGTGKGGSENKIFGEFSANGWTQNTLKHTRGVISMARSSLPDSASSQFFICYTDYPSLNGNYAAFGKVISGMETVDAFLDVERTTGSDGKISKPVTPIVIKTAEVVASPESTAPAA